MSSYSSGKPLILIVDDEPASFDLLTTLLERENYAVVTSVTGKQALQIYQQQSPDIVLLDVMMSPLDGFEVCRQIRQMPNGEHTPILMVTSLNDDEIIKRVFAVGAADYVEKPFRLIELQQRIRRLLKATLAERSEREQRLFAEALLEITKVLNSTLRIEEVLERILTTLGRVIPHTSASILLQREGVVSVVKKHNGEIMLDETSSPEAFAWEQTNISFRQMIETRTALLIPQNREQLAWPDIEGLTVDIQSYVGAPIVLGEEIIGFINLGSNIPFFFNQRHAQWLQAFADQAATAIRNARAYEQTQELVAIEERQRIARDLHDAISQTLFSANMIAETMPHLWTTDPEGVQSGLTKLAQLTKSALAEMRTLLLELRPSALAEVPLEKLIHQLANAFISRSDAEITVFIEGNFNLPEAVHETFYRITQESLNNVIKHTHANNVAIRLRGFEDYVTLQIHDDGDGFDLTQVQPEHMGLRIMQERATSIQAQLTIDSQVGMGCAIELVWYKENIT